MTKEELYALVDTVIKVNPLITTQDKTRGETMRNLLKQLVEFGEDNSNTTFNWNRPITAAIPGIQGTTPTGATVAAGLENVFYPAELPKITEFTAANSTREFGSSPAVGLSWSVEATTYPITSITIANQVISPALTNGTVNTAAEDDLDTTFDMVVTTATQSVSATATVNYRLQRMWFKSGTNLLTATDADISSVLQGPTGKEFSASRQQTRSFTLADEYSYFAYPASAGPATFKVNGLANTAFQLKQFIYTNQFGYTKLYNLYRSGGKSTGFVEIQLA